MSRLKERCCFPVLVAGGICTVAPTTTANAFANISARFPSADFSATAKSARSAAPLSCTDSPPHSASSARRLPPRVKRLWIGNECIKLTARNRQYVVVNAFANGPFGGNPAAIFPHAHGLDDETMQAYAKQLNLIETVYVLPGKGDVDFQLRYFTPGAEIPVAGHPTIAAWVAMMHKNVIDVQKRTSYLQSNLAGTQAIDIDVSNAGDPVVTMKQPPPRFLDAQFSREQVASVFGVSADDLDAELPVRLVDVGLGHVIVPLRSLDALFRVTRRIEPLRQLVESAGVREAQLFCFEAINKSFDMHTRNLCPREGLEDPACGNGNGALTAYLSQFCWPDKKEFTLKIEQGNIVQMPSIIHTRAVRQNESVDVYVGGSGVVMLEGLFLV
jgi:trans-2,3-dihydro-3-hydroxyanthranilate isomerase